MCHNLTLMFAIIQALKLSKNWQEKKYSLSCQSHKIPQGNNEDHYILNRVPDDRCSVPILDVFGWKTIIRELGRSRMCWEMRRAVYFFQFQTRQWPCASPRDGKPRETPRCSWTQRDAQRPRTPSPAPQQSQAMYVSILLTTCDGCLFSPVGSNAVVVASPVVPHGPVQRQHQAHPKSLADPGRWRRAAGGARSDRTDCFGKTVR